MSSTKTALSLGVDADYLEAMERRWREDPAALPETWRFFFAGFELARGGGGGDCRLEAEAARAQSNVASLIYAYRSQGHLIARTDPLGSNPTTVDALELSNWGFDESSLAQVFDTGHLNAPDRLTLAEILAVLRDTYCRSIGVEYVHIQRRPMRRWMQRQLESVRARPGLPRSRKLKILEALVDAEQFERFTHTRYPGQKRFSLEGGEALIAGLQELVELGGQLGVEEIVFGMAHRGRLNVLANIVGMSYTQIFSEFEGAFLPNTVQGDGDVKYHKGYSSDWTTRDGAQVHLSLTANPSHLEAVNPVVEGRVRAKQRRRDDTERREKVLPLLIHGDAAFAGQGVVAETLNLSQLDGYRTGGTVHVIINNQIGFTTLPQEGRSSPYPTDVAKAIEAPILHVNGDDPEAVVFALETGLRFRQRFARDVVVDIVCYRRYGHNEGDDPAFTQPVLYRKIKNRRSVRLRYLEQLVAEGHLDEAESNRMIDEFRGQLEQALEIARRENPTLQVQAFQGVWSGLDGPFTHDRVDTTVAAGQLHNVASALCTVPEGFDLNPKVTRQLAKRLDAVQRGGDVDWSFAELLAFGTLLAEGTPVRLSGQDSARGTFSQRHAVWQDRKTQQPYVPLNNIDAQQARFCVYNSALSEAAVLGFEYGYSLDEPWMLILWEAQFGDFVNGAQVIIDQFITGAESKWQRDSNLVMLLPHGYEGQGPEHSNAYLERFLQGCAEHNISVCVPTTPAQYFHLLRRQIKRSFRMPLVVMTPKSLLRHTRVVSPVAELSDGAFAEVLPDPEPPSRPRRLILCSGKIYWDLAVRRRRDDIAGVVLVRLEQLYPLHWEQLERVVAPLRDSVEEVLWVQEEPRNRGGWSYIYPQLRELFPTHDARGRLGYVGRAASASSAVGSLGVHREEQERILELALGEIPPTQVSDESRDQGPGSWRIDYRGRADRVV